METNASLSEQQIADAGLQRLRSGPSIGARRIAQLRSEAMDSPERRADIIGTLEAYVARRRGSSEARAACRAITTIMTVGMLELLQGD